MFGYICILIALILALYSHAEYRAIAYLVLAEFVAHKLAYIVGYQLTDWLNSSLLFLTYVFIQTITIYLIASIQNHIYIVGLIFINLSYNMLTISQYAIKTIDFYSYHHLVVGSIMILELIYLAWITRYVTNYRRKHGYTSVDYIDRLFRVRGRIHNRSLL